MKFEKMDQLVSVSQAQLSHDFQDQRIWEPGEHKDYIVASYYRSSVESLTSPQRSLTNLFGYQYLQQRLVLCVASND